MLRIVRTAVSRLPLEFRVLYRQFLMRVVDLESLSIDADVPAFLGQFAGLLILVSLGQAYGGLMVPPPPNRMWHIEQTDIALTMLVVGLVSVLTWENTFPDHRDAMVLGPLPVKPRMILIAKIAASAALLLFAVVCLNFASSIGWSLLFAASHGIAAFARFFAAFWITMIASGAFLYGSLLTIQGLTASVLPRRLFLRFSAVVQVVAFAVLFAVYFLAPYIETPADLAALRVHPALAASPVYWFFALFNQCNGSLPPDGLWLAHRAWIGLACAVAGATLSLLVCYRRTMRKTVEEPDLIPARRNLNSTPQIGGGLQSALLLFILRTLWRSRQHRVILALFYSIVFACLMNLVHLAPRIGSIIPITPDFPIITCWMMVFAVLGFRAISPLPISLTANWILRVTQLRPPQDYIAAVWRSTILLVVAPVWVAAAMLSFFYRPYFPAGAHLALLLLMGFILVDIALIGFHKVPFTCSILPGKKNFQFVFWVCLAAIVLLTLFVLTVEFPALQHPVQAVSMVGVFAAVAAGLRLFNRRRAQSAVLYFEEPPIEIITSLGL
ncbi:MAG TPA: hypothetical protein VMT38_00715 [Terracidiphilus sp.]|nr:hypothetical protein [Terracidiphilus sp.]